MNTNQQQTDQVSAQYMQQYAGYTPATATQSALYYPATYPVYPSYPGYQAVPGTFSAGQNPMEAQYMSYYGIATPQSGQTASNQVIV